MPAHPEGTIQHLEAMHEQVSGSVYVHDYNSETPFVDLVHAKVVDAGGMGVWTETRRRIETVQESALFAELRAKALEARKFRLAGRSTVARLAAGHAFELRDHPFEDWNQRYLVLSVEHRVHVPRPGSGHETSVPAGYSNRFVIQPLGVPFRPERVTPRPRVAGLLTGWIESTSDGPAPYLDAQGRYRVRMNYDLANTPVGSGSCWMRMATPFAGEWEGMHFPLQPGTEVIVAHIDGDPDRPVIVGAMFNPHAPNVVTNANIGENRINFRDGMGLTAKGDPARPTDLTDPGKNTVTIWAWQQNPDHAPTGSSPAPFQWLRLGKSQNFTIDKIADIPEGANAADGFDLATGGSGRVFAPHDLFLIRNGSATASDPAISTTPPGNRLIAITESGMLLAHDGVITIGEGKDKTGQPSEVNIQSAGKINLRSELDTTTNIFGNEFKTTRGNSFGFHHGHTQSVFLGTRLQFNVSASFTATAGLNANFIAGLNANFYLGGQLQMLFPGEMKINAGLEIKYLTNKFDVHTVKATESKAALTELIAYATKIFGGKTQVSSAETNVNTLGTKIGQIDKNITTLDVDVNKLDVNIRDIETSNKKISVDNGLTIYQ